MENKESESTFLFHCLGMKWRNTWKINGYFILTFDSANTTFEQIQFIFIFKYIFEKYSQSSIIFFKIQILIETLIFDLYKCTHKFIPTTSSILVENGMVIPPIKEWAQSYNFHSILAFISWTRCIISIFRGTLNKQESYTNLYFLPSTICIINL